MFLFFFGLYVTLGMGTRPSECFPAQEAWGRKRTWIRLRLSLSLAAYPWLCAAALVMPRHTFLSAKLMIIYDITAIKSNIFTIGTEYGKLLRGWLSASGDMNTESLSADNIGSWHLSKLRSNALAVCIAIFSPVCVSPYGHSSGYPIISMPWPCLHSGPLCVWRWR